MRAARARDGAILERGALMIEVWRACVHAVGRQVRAAAPTGAAVAPLRGAHKLHLTSVQRRGQMRLVTPQSRIVEPNFSPTPRANARQGRGLAGIGGKCGSRALASLLHFHRIPTRNTRCSAHQPLSPAHPARFSGDPASHRCHRRQRARFVSALHEQAGSPRALKGLSEAQPRSVRPRVGALTASSGTPIKPPSDHPTAVPRQLKHHNGKEHA